jgi:hypothetical protein
LKRTYVALALLIMILIAVTGCASAKKGSLDFAMDLSSLLKNEAVNRAGITKVTVTLTRTGYDTIIQDLTVSNNVATGRVDNLAAGYWNVKMVVFDGTTALFTGERDIEIVAGLVQQVTILVDPGTDPPTTGSIAFNIGLNPFPGFKPQYQPISQGHDKGESGCETFFNRVTLDLHDHGHIYWLRANGQRRHFHRFIIAC